MFSISVSNKNIIKKDDLFMKLTKSRLKELIKEVAQKHLPGIGDVLLSLNEIHGPDEEERREWADMIDRDISALQGTLEEASAALDGLEPHHEQLLDTLNQITSRRTVHSDDTRRERGPLGRRR
jgi:hypothetical protein